MCIYFTTNGARGERAKIDQLIRYLFLGESGIGKDFQRKHRMEKRDMRVIHMYEQNIDRLVDFHLQIKNNQFPDICIGEKVESRLAAWIK